MNMNKYIIIIAVAIFAVAAISAFGADQKPGNPANDQLSATDIASEANNLRDDNINVRLNAVSRLSKTKDKQAKNELVKEYKRRGSTGYIRGRIMESFALDMDTTTTQEALNTLKTDNDKDLRRSAAYSLGYAKNNSAVQTLIDTFLKESEDINVRCAAAGSLAKQRPSEAVFNCFAQGMLNANPYIRMQAMTSLSICYGSADKKRAIDAITKMLNDRDEMVQNTAKQRLVFLGVKIKK
jgi:HEAT repeat protein